MNQGILSQDEVDALLQGITGESQKLEQEEIEEGGIREYNLASQERIVRGRMPTMEIINERFARNIRVGLFNFIRKSRKSPSAASRCRSTAPSCARSSSRPTSTSCRSVRCAAVG